MCRRVRILQPQYLRVLRGDGKGIELVSGETVMDGYESSATLTTDRLHYKKLTRPHVRGGRVLAP
jgi:hypothetical protein